MYQSSTYQSSFLAFPLFYPRPKLILVKDQYRIVVVDIFPKLIPDFVEGFVKSSAVFSEDA